MSFSADYLLAYNQAIVRTNSAPNVSKTRPFPKKPLLNKRDCIEEVVNPIFCNKCSIKITTPPTLCKGCKKITYCNDTCQRTDVVHKMICVGISNKNSVEITIAEPKENNANSDNVKPAIVKSSESEDDESDDYSTFVSLPKKFDSTKFSAYNVNKPEEHNQYSSALSITPEDNNEHEDYADSVTEYMFTG